MSKHLKRFAVGLVATSSLVSAMAAFVYLLETHPDFAMGVFLGAMFLIATYGLGWSLLEYYGQRRETGE